MDKETQKKQECRDDFKVPAWAVTLITLVEIATATGATTWHADLQNGKLQVFTACGNSNV